MIDASQTINLWLGQDGLTMEEPNLDYLKRGIDDSEVIPASLYELDFIDSPFEENKMICILDIDNWELKQYDYDRLCHFLQVAKDKDIKNAINISFDGMICPYLDTINHENYNRACPLYKNMNESPNKASCINIDNI